jgi:hypothetical protein
LVEESLIDWHFAFGDESTTTAALNFLSRDYLRGIASPDVLERDMPGAWRDAQPAFRAAEAHLQPPHPDWKRFGQFLRKDRRFERLLRLSDAQAAYAFLADQYLRAAEFYGSAALFQVAEGHFRPALAGFRVLYQDARIAMAESSDAANQLGLQAMQVNRMRDLEMRMAVMRARLTGSASDMGAAFAVMEANHDPALQQALEEAYQHGDNFCDTVDREDLAAMAKACEEENSFPLRVINYWRNRAALELLEGGEPPAHRRPRDPFESLKQLLGRLDIEGGVAGLGSWRRQPDETLIGLLLIRADRAADRARTVEGAEAADAVSSALGDLKDAGRPAPPSETPGRFRQIAHRFLALYDWAWNHPDPQVREEVRRPSTWAREAAYFQAVLPRLDQIARGEAQPAG